MNSESKPIKCPECKSTRVNKNGHKAGKQNHICVDCGRQFIDCYQTHQGYGEEDQKNKPGGQPGHQGKTRKGFGRVDRYEINKPETCQWCALRVTRHAGSRELSEAISLQTQQVACLIAKPIEVVEYQTQSCKCLECGGVVRGSLPEGIVPGQDLNINLQALLVSLGNYGHLSYEKQRELVWELGAISIGTGTLQKTNQRVAATVEPAINDLWKWATQRPNVHVDETPLDGSPAQFGV